MTFAAFLGIVAVIAGAVASVAGFGIGSNANKVPVMRRAEPAASQPPGGPRPRSCFHLLQGHFRLLSG